MKRGWSPGELVKKYGYKPNDKKISFKVTLYENNNNNRKNKKETKSNIFVLIPCTHKNNLVGIGKTTSVLTILLLSLDT